jgi:hypothetical protein
MPFRSGCGALRRIRGNAACHSDDAHRPIPPMFLTWFRALWPDYVRMLLAVGTTLCSALDLFCLPLWLCAC